MSLEVAKQLLSNFYRENINFLSNPNVDHKNGVANKKTCKWSE